MFMKVDYNDAKTTVENLMRNKRIITLTQINFPT